MARRLAARARREAPPRSWRRTSGTVITARNARRAAHPPWWSAVTVPASSAPGTQVRSGARRSRAGLHGAVEAGGHRLGAFPPRASAAVRGARAGRAPRSPRAWNLPYPRARAAVWRRAAVRPQEGIAGTVRGRPASRRHASSSSFAATAFQPKLPSHQAPRWLAGAGGLEECQQVAGAPVHELGAHLDGAAQVRISQRVHAPTDAVPGLQHGDVEPGLAQRRRRRQAGHPGPDHQHIVPGHGEPEPAEPSRTPAPASRPDRARLGRRSASRQSPCRSACPSSRSGSSRGRRRSASGPWPAAPRAWRRPSREC